MTIGNYWPEFWKEHGKLTSTLDEQSQVHRTLKKEPVSEDIWKATLLALKNNIMPTSSDSLLELCSGNGLISRYLSDQVDQITAVDISPHLLAKIDKVKFKNIKVITKDIRTLCFPPNSFDTVIIYAGIQYFSYPEAIILLSKIFGWLKKGGQLYIGDIPDLDKRWHFYSTDEYQTLYFDNMKNNNDIIGTWFEKNFMKYLSKYISSSAPVLGIYFPINIT
jgi:ubiquinone/menaquinone biosynthesis C-methylase UbiE